MSEKKIKYFVGCEKKEDQNRARWVRRHNPENRINVTEGFELRVRSSQVVALSNAFNFHLLDPIYLVSYSRNKSKTQE